MFFKGLPDSINDPISKSAPHMLMLVMNSIVVACLSLSLSGCDVSEQAVEMNIEQLRAAKLKLLKNPEDKEALSFILNQLNDGGPILAIAGVKDVQKLEK